MIFSSSTTKEEANDFNNNDIYEFITAMSNEGKSSSTIIRRVTTIRQFYKFLQKEKIIAVSVKKFISHKIDINYLISCFISNFFR